MLGEREDINSNGFAKACMNLRSYILRPYGRNFDRREGYDAFAESTTFAGACFLSKEEFVLILSRILQNIREICQLQLFSVQISLGRNKCGTKLVSKINVHA